MSRRVRFSFKRMGQYREHEAIFGQWGTVTRRRNDPFLLVQSVDPSEHLNFYLTCGDQEGLLPANRIVGELLEKHHFKYEFHSGPGGHNWNQWNSLLQSVFDSLLLHLGV